MHEKRKSPIKNWNENKDVLFSDPNAVLVETENIQETEGSIPWGGMPSAPREALAADIDAERSGGAPGEGTGRTSLPRLGGATKPKSTL